MSIGDNAVTSSIKIAQVFSDLVGKKTRALWKIYREMIKYIINYALYLARYRHIFIQMMTLRSVDMLVSQIILYSLIIHLNDSHMKYCKKSALPWIH